MTNQSVLYNIHARHHAVMKSYGTFELPAHYGSAIQETFTLRHSAGLFDLSHWAMIQISGPDRKTYLHRMVTNEVENLDPGQGNANLILNPQGKVLADFWLLNFEDRLLLLTHAHLKERIISTLDKYLIMEEAEIRDVTSDMVMLSLQGPQAEQTLRQCISEGSLPAEELHHTHVKIEHSELIALRLSHTGEDGFDLLLKPEQAEPVWNKLITSGAHPTGMDALEILRVEAGIPVVDKDLDDKVIPQEARLHHALSFTKGCYLGQEVVARLHFRGHVNRELTGFYLNTPQPPEQEVLLTHEGKPVGSITSAVLSPTLNRVIGIGFLRCKLREEGREIQGENAGEQITATVANLPLVQKNGSNAG
ncbi:MAG: YgfZ/GcvT domain-containing protein [bacterium]